MPSPFSKTTERTPEPPVQRHQTTPPTPPAPPAAPAPAAPKPTVPEQPKPVESKPTWDAPIFLADDAELIKATAPRNARNDEQRKMDDAVKSLHSKWVAAGRPSQWPVMVSKGCVATIPVEPQHAAKLKAVINRAATLHGVAPRWGTPVLVTEEFIRKQAARGVVIPAHYLGREMVSFAVRDKRDRKTDTATAQAAVGQKRPE